MEKNCFCLQDSASIEALIYDGYDDFTRGLINFATYDSSCVLLLNSYKKVQISTAIANEPIDKQFLIYPNPATDQLIIESKGAQNRLGKLQILDHIGRIKLVTTIGYGSNIQVDISDLEKGIYWIRDTESAFVVSFVKN